MVLQEKGSSSKSTRRNSHTNFHSTLVLIRNHVLTNWQRIRGEDHISFFEDLCASSRRSILFVINVSITTQKPHSMKVIN